MTTKEPFPLVLPERVALCILCKTLTSAPVAVREIHSSSGPGTTLWACPEHAVTLGAGPTSEDVHRAS
ncbi:hypothetical protein ACFYYB_07920 [Streptomyces sp. NPDC002886]|uniref:hypothetical protein n=1 Tax=Streptomyces sp. NPDC002886 TaxID=3364667 RepID=UPI0036B09FD4